MTIDESTEFLSFNALTKRLKKAAKRSLPAAAVRGIQSTVRPLRRAKLRIESTLNPRQFLDDPFPKVDVHYVRPQEINLLGQASQCRVFPMA